MSTTVKNREIEELVNRKPPIFTNRGLPVKVVYWLSKLEKELVRCLKDYYKVRMEIISTFCKKDEEGKLLQNVQADTFEFLDDKARGMANQRVLELLDMEVIIPFDKIQIKLADLQGLISADEMVIMDPFIEFTE